MSEPPDFRKVLLSRHGEGDTICVTAYKVHDGKKVAALRFCSGVDQAAGLIGRAYEREDILAIWTNIQRLKPGSGSRRKDDIEAYTNVVIDIDRRWKTIHEDGTLCKHGKKEKETCGGFKCNATDAERGVLLEVAEKVSGFMVPLLGQAIFADSGNGYHVAGRCGPLDPKIGKDLYGRVLALLRAKFEQPGLNMEIDLSLADEGQVVTVWGTWNRKYPDMLERPQRQSKVLLMPTLPMKEISEIDLELFLLENRVESSDSLDSEESAPRTTKKKDQNKANPEWLEDYGVDHLVKHFSKYLEYEGDVFEKSDGTYHPVTPCYAHANEPDGHEHGTPHDCCIIEFNDGGIGLSCWNKDFGLKSMIKLLNQKIVEDGGEKYPHLVFAEESDQEVAKAFGVEDANAEITPVGELCYRENCLCGLVHVQRPKPQELFDPNDKSYDLVHTETDGGSSGLRVLRISDSPDAPWDWLWPDRIPAGVAFTVSGPVGCNKSMMLCDMAALISNGSDWPDGTKNEFGPREVLICATEDDLQKAIRPRLRAAKANLEKCLFLKNAFDVDKNGKRKSRTMDLEKDTQRLYEALKAHPEILLVILDPVTGFYGNADPNDNKQIRKMMTKISTMCQRTNAAVGCIIHENKKSDVNVVDKMAGASSVSQVIRAGMRISFDPENEPNGRIMAMLKSSYGTRGGGMKFTVEQVDMVSTDGRPLKNIGFVKWGEAHTQTADQVKTGEQEQGAENSTKLGVAVHIYETELANGKRLHRDVHRVLDAAGISDATKRRARAKLGVASSRSAPWYWWLPGKEHEEDSPERKMQDAEVL